MKIKSKPLQFLALTVALALAPQLHAASDTVSIIVPDFLIPLGGQHGTLTLFSDGRAPETSGFNVLGSQRLTLPGNSVSSGTVTLNLSFSGFQLDDTASEVSGAALYFTVRDFDFLGDKVSTGVNLTETAVLTAINGSPLAVPMDLANYLPPGTTATDDKTLTLNPILLAGPALPASFSEPLIFSFTLRATVATHGPRSITLFNGTETIASEISLTVAPAPVPEPSTWALIGMGALLGLTQVLRRRF